MELVRDKILSMKTIRPHRRPLVECRQCGYCIDMPEWSENLDGDRVRHLWSCEACGYSFETTVRFAAA